MSERVWDRALATNAAFTLHSVRLADSPGVRGQLQPVHRLVYTRRMCATRTENERSRRPLMERGQGRRGSGLATEVPPTGSKHSGYNTLQEPKTEPQKLDGFFYLHFHVQYCATINDRGLSSDESAADNVDDAVARNPGYRGPVCVSSGS